ncbi:MAG: hypothetical protein A2Y24_08580 [Clostridiales bacterium GWE2_32_10]|nr:MAG: hypothetical protein A2Y24_08580 [Clostridiales bacterium GWE2_32_10]HBY21173.1 MarR family transcriptional regulator [Clostridiales bacterium]
MNEELGTLNELLVKNFKDILRIEEKVLNKKDETKDLSMNEIHTLEIIGIDKQQIMSDIAKKLNITIGTLSIAISKLLKKGYIEKVKSDKDKRAIKICFTDKGELAYKAHENFHKEMIAAVIKELSIDEFKIIIEFLNRINKFFINKYDLN